MKEEKETMRPTVYEEENSSQWREKTCDEMAEETKLQNSDNHEGCLFSILEENTNGKQGSNMMKWRRNDLLVMKANEVN